MAMRIGIDLGGTKIEVIALAKDGRELIRRRIPTPQGDYQATVMAVAALVESVEHELGQAGSVGVGIPGAEAVAGGLIKNANSVCLIGKPLRHDLQTRLQREIRLANDANCFALSEATDGAGKGCAVVFGAILGTGVGGGIVVHQRVLTGANHIAGEWGHNPFPFTLPLPPETLPTSPTPPACYCGRTNCIETWLSGPGLAADHVRHGGDSLSCEAISLKATAGDTACEATLQRYEKRLAQALAQVINLLDPDVIVLGGGLSRLDRLYTNVPRYWLPCVFSDQIATRLCPPQYGDASGVRGAAWLWGRH